MRTISVDVVKSTGYERSVEVELPNGEFVVFELSPLHGKYLDKLHTMEGNMIQLQNSLKNGKELPVGVATTIGKEVFDLMRVWFKGSVARGDGVSDEEYDKAIDIILTMNGEVLLKEFVLSHTSPSKRKELELIDDIAKINECKERDRKIKKEV